jgi:endoglucanase
MNQGGRRAWWCAVLIAMIGFASTTQGAGAGYWHTSGNQIVDANNQPVRIAAVNWYGFETTLAVAHGLWAQDYKTILNLIKSSGYNTIRIPYSDQMVQTNPVVAATSINRNGMNTDLPPGTRSMQVLDAIITHCGTIGLRVILDNHRSNAGDSAQESGMWFTDQFPESVWLANWRALTQRYLGNTTVIGMDVRNEPHNQACWGGDPSGCPANLDWAAAAERAGNAILAINPNLLIIVEGNASYNGAFTWWGGMLRGVATRPIVLSVPNRVVYSAHDYGPHLASQSWFNGSTTPASLNAVWNQNWGFIYNQNIAPVWLGEFGTTNNAAEIQSTAAGSQGQWFSSLVQYLGARPSMNWAYWAMNGNDAYALFNNTFGAIVSQQKQQLLASIQFPLDTDVTTPTISSLSPTSGAVGTAVTISGSNFGGTQGTSAVRFNTTVATVTSWSNSQIVATVPNIAAGPVTVTVTVGSVASNGVSFTVGTTPTANFSLTPTPTSLSVQRGSSGTVSVTIARTGGFTGPVAFSTTGLPAGVTAAFTPASTTTNSTVLTLSASATATLGNATVTINGNNATVGTRSTTVALSVTAPPTGSVTVTPVVASNNPWFMEEQIRIANTASITALSITITVQRNPAALAIGGQYNSVGPTVQQSSSTTATQLTYQFTLASGQTLGPSTSRTFAAQIRGNGTPHPTAGDTYSVTYTAGGATSTVSGTF